MTGRAFYSDEPNRVIDNEDILRLYGTPEGKLDGLGITSLICQLGFTVYGFIWALDSLG